MILKYFFTFVIFFILDYCFSKQYKNVFTWFHVFVTIGTALLFGFVLYSLYRETWIEDLIRFISMNLLAEIALYFVVIKYKLLKQT